VASVQPRPPLRRQACWCSKHRIRVGLGLRAWPRGRLAQATDAEETQRDAAALGDLAAELAAAEEREAAEAARAHAAERAAAAADDARRRMEADLQQAHGLAALRVTRF